MRPDGHLPVGFKTLRSTARLRVDHNLPEGRDRRARHLVQASDCLGERCTLCPPVGGVKFLSKRARDREFERSTDAEEEGEIEAISAAVFP